MNIFCQVKPSMLYMYISFIYVCTHIYTFIIIYIYTHVCVFRFLLIRVCSAYIYTYICVNILQLSNWICGWCCGLWTVFLKCSSCFFDDLGAMDQRGVSRIFGVRTSNCKTNKELVMLSTNIFSASNRMVGPMNFDSNRERQECTELTNRSQSNNTEDSILWHRVA